MEKFLDSSARGDLATVTALLSGAPSLINRRGDNEWTALMLAARNGHHDVVKDLLLRGYIQVHEYTVITVDIQSTDLYCSNCTNDSEGMSTFVSLDGWMDVSFTLKIEYNSSSKG